MFTNCILALSCICLTATLRLNVLTGVYNVLENGLCKKSTGNTECIGTRHGVEDRSSPELHCALVKPTNLPKLTLHCHTFLTNNAI